MRGWMSAGGTRGLRAGGIWALGLLLAGAALAASPADEDAAVMKAVRRAERAGFERHQLDRYLAGFTPDAEWVFGRDATPGPYDRRFPRADFERYRALDWSQPPTGRDRMYFHDAAVQREGDTATVEVEVRLTFFGGEIVEGRRYTLRRGKAGWQIAAVRSWPKLEIMGMERSAFNAEEWARLDKELAVSEGDEVISGLSRVVSLAHARRFEEAHRLAQELAQAVDAEGRRDPRAVLAWANLAVETNRLDEAREVIEAALKADPRTELPVGLRTLVKGGKGRSAKPPGKKTGPGR